LSSGAEVIVGTASAADCPLGVRANSEGPVGLLFLRGLEKEA